MTAPATIRECRELANYTAWQVVRAMEAGHVDEDLAFDLREAAEQAEDLAPNAPNDVLRDELLDVAARAREKADPDLAPDPELAERRVDLLAAIRNADVEPPWRCDRLVADGHVTVLAGRGGEGKSLLALALVGAVQTGQTIAGIETQPGQATIFDAENGTPLIGRRLKWAETPLERLAVYDASQVDLIRDVDALEQTVRHHQAGLVVFDSLRTLAPRARENDSDDMAPIMGALRRVARNTQAGVLVLHHRDKQLEHAFRGSGAIHDQADLVFVLDRDDKDPERRWRRRIACAKCRIDVEPEDRWIGIRGSHGQLYISQAAAPEHRTRTAPARDELADQIIEILRAAGEPLTRPDLARRLDRDKSDGTVRRALETLEEAGRVTRPTKSSWALPPDQMATRPLPGLANPDSNGTRAVANEPDGNPGNPTTGQSCQGALSPEGGGAAGNPDDHSEEAAA